MRISTCFFDISGQASRQIFSDGAMFPGAGCSCPSARMALFPSVSSECLCLQSAIGLIEQPILERKCCYFPTTLSCARMKLWWHLPHPCCHIYLCKPEQQNGRNQSLLTMTASCQKTTFVLQPKVGNFSVKVYIGKGFLKGPCVQIQKRHGSQEAHETTQEHFWQCWVTSTNS